MSRKTQDKLSTNIHRTEIFVETIHHDGLCAEFSVMYPISTGPASSFIWAAIIATLLYYMFYVFENTSLSVTVLCAVLLFSFVYCHFIKVHKESLLVIASSGIQYMTTYRTGRQLSLFIPIDCVQDVVINEGITMHSVIYYLVVLMKDPQNGKAKSLLPIFMKTSPRINTLREIYQGIQGILWSRKHSFSQTTIS
ncbi:phosphatidylinositol N-acetylglucosaminyltransferase subunit H-like [Ptychodera flava]|uniref:phosphatidylinositol N-acetylglucosaminyltransferase subunit H-like n=1 Tax=Ptychodera flava TaxID=63121 RepID=UPI003969E448